MRFVGRPLACFVVTALATIVQLVAARASVGAHTPEEACHKGRYSAAAKYSACHQKALGQYFALALADESFQRAVASAASSTPARGRSCE